ncbi:MAG: glutamate--tRNA ligase, partial [Acidobacteriaceae bacterium]
WGAEGGTRETFTMSELAAEFTLERVTPSPAIFDFNKLHWLNRHYLKLAEPARILELARPYFVAQHWLPDPSTAEVDAWFLQLLALFLPGVDQLDQLPKKARFIFAVDPTAAMANEENAAVFANPSARAVLEAFAARIAALPSLVTAEAFKTVMNEVKAASGAKGKDLFHPVRIALTGAHSGPEFDKLVPLIEAGSALALPTPVLSVRQRAEMFLAALPPV